MSITNLLFPLRVGSLRNTSITVYTNNFTLVGSVMLQLPALICPGITLVISPLVSLIQDQIMHLLQVMFSVSVICPAFIFIYI